MTIYTPDGLKIRIDFNQAFGLMSRLYPKVSVHKMLKTIDSITRIPGMFAFFAGIACILLQVSPFYTAPAVAAACIFGVLGNIAGFYRIPGLLFLGSFFGYAAGYGLYYSVIIAAGLTYADWQIVLAYFAGKVFGSITGFILEYYQAKKHYLNTDRILSSSEISFFKVYLLYAAKLGVSNDLELFEYETRPEKWGPAFTDLATSWPSLVNRFHIEE